LLYDTQGHGRDVVGGEVDPDKVIEDPVDTGQCQVLRYRHLCSRAPTDRSLRSVMTTKSIKLAAVQIQCEVGRAEKNLAHATRLVEQAATHGANVIVLPELTPGGYVLTEEIWSTAEPFNGVSVSWLKRTARRLGIYLGTSFLEAEGRDFYNSFALVTPDGEIAGRVRKSPPASAEAYFFRRGDDQHFIDTELGRIGVGICDETLLYERITELYQASVDLVLQPMSAGTPAPRFPVRHKDTVALERMVQGIAAHYAKALGVPVAMANKCGPLVTPLPGIMPTQRTELALCQGRFPGLSAVADSDGTLKSQLGSEEGIAIAEVVFDPSRKGRVPPRRYGRWALPVPWVFYLVPIAQKLGERAYARNPTRAARALAVTNAVS
jgi:N-carbamoylputrescine amidase